MHRGYTLAMTVSTNSVRYSNTGTPSPAIRSCIIRIVLCAQKAGIKLKVVKRLAAIDRFMRGMEERL